MKPHILIGWSSDSQHVSIRWVKNKKELESFLKKELGNKLLVIKALSKLTTSKNKTWKGDKSGDWGYYIMTPEELYKNPQSLFS